MPNSVFQTAVQSLSSVVSARAAETMLQAALSDLKLSADTVTARDMQRVLSGPLERRLSQVMPGTSAFDKLRLLSQHFEKLDPKAPTLFDQSVRTVIWDQQDDTRWSEDEFDSPADDLPPGGTSPHPPVLGRFPGGLMQSTKADLGDFLDDDPLDHGLDNGELLMPPAQDALPTVLAQDNASRGRHSNPPAPQQTPAAPIAPLPGVPPQAIPTAEVSTGEASMGEDGAGDFSADDFEFSDPEYGHLQASRKRYALDTAAGQDALLLELARQAGVQTVVLCNTAGQVLNVRAPQGAPQLGSVVAATALLFRDRELKLLSADLGNATICLRVVGPYCVALLARGGVNVGRLLSELQQIEVAA